MVKWLPPIDSQSWLLIKITQKSKQNKTMSSTGGTLASEFSEGLHCSARINNHCFYPLLCAMANRTESLAKLVCLILLQNEESSINRLKNHSWFCWVEELFLFLQTQLLAHDFIPSDTEEKVLAEKASEKLPPSHESSPHRSLDYLLTSSSRWILPCSNLRSSHKWVLYSCSGEYTISPSPTIIFPL